MSKLAFRAQTVDIAYLPLRQDFLAKNVLMTAQRDLCLGNSLSKSDIDLGILFSKDVDGFTRINLETEISNLLRKDVDLINMKKSGPVLRHQIYKYGRLIYDDGSDFPFQFRAGSIRDYLDADYLRRLRSANLYGQS